MLDKFQEGDKVLVEENCGSVGSNDSVRTPWTKEMKQFDGFVGEINRKLEENVFTVSFVMLDRKDNKCFRKDYDFFDDELSHASAGKSTNKGELDNLSNAEDSSDEKNSSTVSPTETVEHLQLKNGKTVRRYIPINLHVGFPDSGGKKKEIRRYSRTEMFRFSNHNFKKCILEQSPSVWSVKNNDGDTLLHLMVKHERTDLLMLFSEEDPKWTELSLNEHSRCLFHNGTTKPCLPLPRGLFHNGLFHHSWKKELRPGVRNSDGRNCLDIAVINGSVTFAQFMLDLDPGLVNGRNSDELTPVHIAVEHGRKNMVQFLIENGGDVNARDCNVQTPLHCAVMGFAETITKHEPVKMKDRLAKLRDKAAVIRLLIDHGADIEAGELWKEDRPLHLAMREIRKHRAQVINFGADVILNVQMKEEWILNELETELCEMCVKCPVLIPAYMLLALGANLSTKNSEGETPYDCLKHKGLRFSFLNLAALHVRGARTVCACGSEATVFAVPCHHFLGCMDCIGTFRHATCPTCENMISDLSHKRGEVVNPEKRIAELERERRELVDRVERMEEGVKCPICRVRNNNVVLSCGHLVCSKCGSRAKLQFCPLCQEKIGRRNILYLNVG